MTGTTAAPRLHLDAGAVARWLRESPARTRAAAAGPRVPRGWLATGSVLLALLAFAQAPGKIVSDTKLDMPIDPIGFLGRALHLWDATGNLGQVQNQAGGYLFPMGPFFAFGTGVGIPPWVVQRLWMTTLLIASFVGVAKLLDRFGTGTPGTRLIGALTYALAPRVLALLGTNSAELLPTCVLPWALLPLVHSGNSARRKAMWSGLAFLAMGGTNAATVIAVASVPAMYILTRPRGTRAKLAGWWVLAVGLAVAWWFVPLALLARYGFPFLPYTETASATTSSASLIAATRGTSDWVSWLVVDFHAWWPAGFTAAVNPVLVVLTGTLAAGGLVGLFRQDMPDRRFWTLSATAGLLLLTVGHASALSAPFAGQLRDLLDGALSPLRNMHKFDPLLRLPLAVGLTHLLSRPRAGQRGSSRQWSVLAPVTSGLAVAALGLTAVTAQVVTPGGFDRIPAYWTQATDWLGEHSADNATLLLPAAAFGEYTWGRTMDEPAQALMSSRWVARSLVPPGSAGLARLLSEIDERVGNGQGSPGLAPVLSRMGVRYILVRNDLDPSRTQAAEPVAVAHALNDSPGIRRVATFGPATGGTFAFQEVLDHNLAQFLPSLVVYEVAGDVSPVTAYDLDQLVRVTGAPEDVLDLADAGLLDGAPTVLDADAGPATRTLLTDSLRRRELDFGRVRDNASATLGPGDVTRWDRPTTDITDPAWPAGAQTQLRYRGVSAVTASSAASDANAVIPPRGPEYQPYAALDGDAHTAWLSIAEQEPVGQWLRLALDTPLAFDHVDVAFTDVRHRDATVSRVRVETDNGAIDQAVTGSGTHRLRVPPGPTSTLRLVITAVAGNEQPGERVGIATLAVPGLTAERYLALPPPTAGSPQDVYVSREASSPPCLAFDIQWLCSPDQQRVGEEPHGLRRTFGLTAPTGGGLGVWAQPVAGPALDELLYGRLGVVARASSQAYPQAVADAYAAVDGDPTTSWWASPGDKRPTLALHWTGLSTVRGLRLAMPPANQASRPYQVQVTGRDGTRTAPIDKDGTVRFAALHTDSLTISFLRVVTATTFSRQTLRDDALPLAISDVRVDGFTHPPRADWPAPVTVPCGVGPDLLVDGQPVQTGATTTVGDLLAGRTVQLTPCPSRLVLQPGRHSLVADRGDLFDPTAAYFGRPAPDASTQRVDVQQFGPTNRRVQLPAGKASVLVVHENSNPGWVATVDDQRLTPIRVDGWQQGFLVPAGTSGLVQLTYTPDRVYRASLLAGLLGVLALIALAFVPTKRPETPSPEEPAETTPAEAPKQAGVLAGALATARDWPPWLAVLVGYWLAGFLGVALAAAVLALRWRRLLWRLRGDVACGVLVMLAAFGQAVARYTTSAALSDWLPQTLCLTAWLAVLAAVPPAEPVPAEVPEEITPEVASSRP